MCALLFPLLAYFQHWSMITILATLFIVSVYNIKHKIFEFNQVNKWLIYAFLFLFISALPNVIMDSLYAGKAKLSALDVPSRYLCGAIILLALSRVKIKIEHLFWGVFLGLLVAFMLYPVWASYVLGFTRYFHGHPTFANVSIDVLAVAYISIVFMMSSLVGTLYFAFKKQKKLTYIALICANLASIIMMQSGSKVALLAYPLILLLIIVVWKESPHKLKVLLLTPIFTAMLLFSMPKLTLNNNNQSENVMQQRLFSDLSDMDKRSSTTIRLDIWKGGWLSFVDSPVLGQGYEERIAFHNQLVDDGHIKYKMNKGKSSLHNEFFNAIAKKGLLGLFAIALLYLAPLLFFYRAMKASSSNYYSSLNGVFIVFSFIIIGFTEAPLMGTFTSTFYVLTIILAYLSIDKTQLNANAASNHQEL